MNLSCRVDSVFPEPEVDLMWTRGREVNINSETDDFRSENNQTRRWLGYSSRSQGSIKSTDLDLSWDLYA